MQFSIRVHLVYETAQPVDLLLQIEAAEEEDQHLQSVEMTFDPEALAKVIEGEEGIGTRRWIQVTSGFQCTYQAQVDVARRVEALDGIPQMPPVQIPADVIKYLMPSRYCHPEVFLDFVSTQFGDLQGGALIIAMRDWISSNFTYDSAASPIGATATDSFNSLSGVCRDYAHMLITFSRAAAIPARFVSVYGPDVTPQDFHAVAEVYLDGAWHLVDATGMAKPEDMVRIGVGRDAADASFMTSYGWMDLIEQTVEVSRLGS